ncbi:MAG: CoA activase, partial [Planctomycetes bacterium]|nr:CoA activase [Planctomycetota bacterium]
SKYIRLRDGVVVDFEMNHVCAAGTGSFLEEQAERLGISIKDEFARLALSSESPIRLGERCTVFMESDIMHHQQQGAALPDLVAGLCYSIAANYLNRVVGTRSIGEHILFQGGTAFNRAVTSAFAALTERPITVPPHHEVTGALGVALLVRDAHRQGRYEASAFRGFDLAERPYKVRSFTCQACSNYCDIREVRIEGQPPLYYGSRCDRYNRKKQEGSQPSDLWPDLMAERQRLLLGLPAESPTATCNEALRSDSGGATRGTVGIPRALVFHQMLPFWRTLMERLGFEVLVSPGSDAAIIQAGVESVLSQTCFPVKVAHGHVRWLADQGVDAVLLPSILALPRDHESQSYNHLCPYVQTFTYQVESALNLTASGVKTLRPIVDMEEGYEAGREALAEWGRGMGVAAGEMSAALDVAIAAQRGFEDACLERGRRLLASPPEGAQLAVLVGRPYNTCDVGINLDVAQRMRAVGLLAVPMDMLDLREFDLGRDWDNLYWKYGQRVIRAAELIRERPELGAVYISNFGCGPDSFIKRFFQEAMGRRAFLSLEIDEHSAPAGLVTRLEAFVDSLHGAGPQAAEGPRQVFPVSDGGNGRTLLVPHMCDHAYAFAAAFRGSGLKAEVIPPSDDESLALGRRYTSGRECLPCIVTAGDMLRELRREGADPSRMAFFMPSGTGPCRFGMYSKLHRLILREAGYPDVPVVSPNQGESFYEDFKKLPRDPTRPAWCGIVAVDALVKALHTTRPYERTPGQTDTVYAECLKLVAHALEHGEDLPRVMGRCAAMFRDVATDGRGSRPLVGVVGEIYVRSHAFSNQDVVRRLEALGLEVDLASFAEWIYYTNWTRKRRTRNRGQYRLWLGTWVKERVQRFDERRIKRPLADLIGEPMETETQHVVALGHPYIHDSFEGEAVLSLGKAVEVATHARPGTGQRATGIVNVMPFTCMPGNIVAAMLKRLRRDLDDLPILSVAYDGQRDSALDVRLEAFAEQVKAFSGAACARRGTGG